MTELLKQDQYSPLQMEEEAAVLYAGVKGYLDNVVVNKVGDFEQMLLLELRNNHVAILESIRTEQKITDETESKLKELLSSIVKQFVTME